MEIIYRYLRNKTSLPVFYCQLNIGMSSCAYALIPECANNTLIYWGRKQGDLISGMNLFSVVFSVTTNTYV